MAAKKADGKSKSPSRAKKKAGGKSIRLADGVKTRKPAKKAAVSKRKPTALHEKLFKLFTRPQGATITDTVNAGFVYPVMAAVKIAERHGLKITKKKEDGELTRYIAARR